VLHVLDALLLVEARESHSDSVMRVRKSLSFGRGPRGCIVKMNPKPKFGC